MFSNYQSNITDNISAHYDDFNYFIERLLADIVELENVQNPTSLLAKAYITSNTMFNMKEIEEVEGNKSIILRYTANTLNPDNTDCSLHTVNGYNSWNRVFTLYITIDNDDDGNTDYDNANLIVRQITDKLTNNETLVKITVPSGRTYTSPLAHNIATEPFITNEEVSGDENYITAIVEIKFIITLDN